MTDEQITAELAWLENHETELLNQAHAAVASGDIWTYPELAREAMDDAIYHAMDNSGDGDGS